MHTAAENGKSATGYGQKLSMGVRAILCELTQNFRSISPEGYVQNQATKGENLRFQVMQKMDTILSATVN